MLCPQYRRSACPLLVALTFTLTASAAVQAGGSPETTLLVVNADSPLSLAVANEYIRLRALPERQVLWLKNIPTVDTIEIETFRKRILEPIRAHITATGLEAEIDLIAYSAGFPYAVNFRSDAAANGLTKDRYRGDAGSLTGMTFFAREVLAGRVGYLSLRANHYFRPLEADPSSASAPKHPQSAPFPAATRVVQPHTRGFRAQYRWASVPGHQPAASDGRYYLSVMLGYTGLRGNSLPEITHYLRRATSSDGTRPDGTVYMMENRNIRGRVRRHLFESTATALIKRGRRAEILTQGRNGQNGREPKHKTDIIGLVAGARSFSWEHADSHFLPGAIAESFTSYGGHFAHSSQTKLTEFLRLGAVGSSGAVREPYAILEKFPLPQLHVHYADGSSLAEAFYQSVANPYQLLVVGDPLARPFARFVEVTLAAPAVDVPWRGTVDVRPRVLADPKHPVDRVELWVDGLRLATATPGHPMTLDTANLADGEHELRLIAVEAGAIETRSSSRSLIRVANRDRHVELAELPGTAAHGALLALSGRAEGARAVSVQQGTRVLATASVTDGRWQAEVDTAALGMGEVALYATADFTDGGHARSAASRVRIVPPPLFPADPQPGADKVGLRVDDGPAGADADAVTIGGLDGRLPRKVRDRAGGSLRIRGAFEVRVSGLYELTLEATGKLALKVGNGRPIHLEVATDAHGARLPLPLAAGWHRFELTLTEARSHHLRALLAGPEPAFELAGDRIARP